MTLQCRLGQELSERIDLMVMPAVGKWQQLGLEQAEPGRVFWQRDLAFLNDRANAEQPRGLIVLRTLRNDRGAAHIGVNPKRLDQLRACGMIFNEDRLCAALAREPDGVTQQVGELELAAEYLDDANVAALDMPRNADRPIVVDPSLEAVSYDWMIWPLVAKGSNSGS